MSKNLIIVESPAKAKTIQKFIGKDFTVISSKGHVCDLPQKDIGIDVAKGFEPKYIILDDKKALINDIKKKAQDADVIWLATDDDREGEAISWHLMQVTKMDPSKVRRIVFHEITKGAIENALANPRDLNIDLVNAQQARRVLDRLVGFELSPVLWRKVKPQLSAGRVQSVAVKLIVEREHEIDRFNSTFSYRVEGDFVTERDRQVELTTELNKKFNTREEAMMFLENCKSATFKVAAIEKSPGKKSPAPPFTTSTLQQEAARKLGFSVSKTMVVAQQLYEAGYITYMRTDSVNLSAFALATAKEVITELYGAEYSHLHNFVTRTKGAQEAHEAIRPTDMSRQTVPGDTFVKHLYELIWKRTIASQMSDAKTEKTSITIPVSNRSEKFVANGEVILFPGFLKVYTESKDEESEEIKGLLPVVQQGENLLSKSITATQRFAQPPARYTEASLVKKLEELGIGRPSTYAPTITTIQKRGYVQKATRPGKERKYDCLILKNGVLKEEERTEKYGYEKEKIIPTDVGIVVNDYLQENFQDIMDYGFTADVEKEFDDIAEGKEQWQNMLQRFYGGFHDSVDHALNYSAKASGERLLGYDPATNAKVFAKLGKYGPMVQIGENYADEKPRYARLRPNQFIETITLEEAMELFKLPRTVGDWNGHEITVGAGRFGPYVRYENTFVSIPKDEDPISISLERCIQILEEKQKKDADRAPRLIGHYNGKEIMAAAGRYGPYLKYDGKNITLGKGMDLNSLTEAAAIDFLQNAQTKNVLRSFEEDDNIKVMNGRYGAYITNGTDNFKIPKGTAAENMTYQDCLEIIRSTTPTAKKRIIRKKS
ncbi:MAG: type I DNA topoisomerase [Bacteroidales bacterium]|nr:type I DNA topoisomerase [Bacteroidales bacterium]MBR6162111.1 type I DNA topoisomerase [Bacteroidales bacterium]